MIKCTFNTSEEEAALIAQYKALGYSIEAIYKLRSGNTIIFKGPSVDVHFSEIVKLLISKNIITKEELPALLAAKLTQNNRGCGLTEQKSRRQA